jgi:hypothetical protein
MYLSNTNRIESVQNRIERGPAGTTTTTTTTSTTTAAPSGNPVTTGRVLELNPTTSSYVGTGTTWLDVSGLGFNFTTTGSPSFVGGTGWVLNGTNQWFYLPSSSSAVLDNYFTGSLNDGVTLFVDVVYGGSTEGTMVAAWNELVSTDQKVLFEVNTDKTIETAVKSASGIIGHNTTNTITNGVRSVMMMIVSGSTKYAFKNNEQMSGSNACSGTWASQTPMWMIGSRPDAANIQARFLSGSIKSVVAYNRALTRTEQTDVYNYILAL